MPLDLASRPMLPEMDRRRAEQNALRTRLLNGTWQKDLEDGLRRHIRQERRNAWGVAEMSRNPFRSLATQIGGALYRTPPIVRGPPEGAGLTQAVQAAGFWELQQRASTDLVGLREGFLRVDWTKRGGLLHRPVPLDLLHLEAVHEAPDVPALVEEIQARKDPKTGEWEWAWEVLDIRDLDKPKHLILSGDRTQDWTEHNLGGPKSGDAYQYRDTKTGTPYIPGVLYHAERHGKLLDSFYGVEAVLGTITTAVLMTFWVHGVKDGSFATVVVVGGRVVGLEVENGDGATTNVISTEPGAIIEVSPADDGIQPQVIQLQPGFDPEKLMNAIGLFEGGLAEYAGVSAADLVRTGADPRSGVSLSVSREGLRGAQAKFEPQLRRGDLEILEVTAKVLNHATGTAYPEDRGLYAISYPSLPLSSSELTAQREDIVAKTDAGLMSQVDAFKVLNPGFNTDQAIAELARIATEKALVERATKQALAAAGVIASTPVVEIEVGKAALIPVFVQAAQAGTMPVDAAREGLIAIGIPAERATAIMASVKPTTPTTPTP